MGLQARFQALAVNLIETTFVEMAKSLVLTQLGEWNQATQSAPTVATDTTIGIDTGFTKNEIDGASIQEDDYQIIFAATGITVDLKADNVECVFNGIDLNIESVNVDPATARYIIHCRTL